MSEIGTGYIIQVQVETCKRDVRMEDVGFSVDFYVYPNRRVHFDKREMIRVAREDCDWYFALLDSERVGKGQLRARVNISDPVSQWPGGKRPVIIDRLTGKIIGGHSCSTYGTEGCDCFDEGYRVSFNFVDGLPRAEVAYIFYGNLVNQIMSYSDITQEMLVSPDNHIISVQADRMGKTSLGQMAEGARIVVLIPNDTPYTATKDNGIGGKVPFNESIMGANGNHTVTIDGIVYRAYGELLTTDGEMFIYVD